jgi:SAM-dependent methyltransferase
MVSERPWNVNIHYRRLLLQAIPDEAKRVLDVGCGDGVLCAQLVHRGEQCVVGLDTDAGVLGWASTRFSGLPIEWVLGDILGMNLLSGHPYDAVLSVAALHHMDATAGLTRFAELVRPGGVVGVIGLAANDWWDLPHATFGQWMRRVVGVTRGYWNHSAPVAWPPPATYRKMKRIAYAVLPGVRYKRHLFGRCSIVWTRPDTRTISSFQS